MPHYQCLDGNSVITNDEKNKLNVDVYSYRFFTRDRYEPPKSVIPDAKPSYSDRRVELFQLNNTVTVIDPNQLKILDPSAAFILYIMSVVSPDDVRYSALFNVMATEKLDIISIDQGFFLIDDLKEIREAMIDATWFNYVQCASKVWTDIYGHSSRRTGVSRRSDKLDEYTRALVYKSARIIPRPESSSITFTFTKRDFDAYAIARKHRTRIPDGLVGQNAAVIENTYRDKRATSINTGAVRLSVNVPKVLKILSTNTNVELRLDSALVSETPERALTIDYSVTSKIPAAHVSIGGINYSIWTQSTPTFQRSIAYTNAIIKACRLAQDYDDTKDASKTYTAYCLPESLSVAPPNATADLVQNEFTLAELEKHIKLMPGTLSDAEIAYVSTMDNSFLRYVSFFTVVSGVLPKIDKGIPCRTGISAFFAQVPQGLPLMFWNYVSANTAFTQAIAPIMPVIKATINQYVDDTRLLLGRINVAITRHIACIRSEADVDLRDQYASGMAPRFKYEDRLYSYRMYRESTTLFCSLTNEKYTTICQKAETYGIPLLDTLNELDSVAHIRIMAMHRISEAHPGTMVDDFLRRHDLKHVSATDVLNGTYTFEKETALLDHVYDLAATIRRAGKYDEYLQLLHECDEFIQLRVRNGHLPEHVYLELLQMEFDMTNKPMPSRVTTDSDVYKYLADPRFPALRAEHREIIDSALSTVLTVRNAGPLFRRVEWYLMRLIASGYLKPYKPETSYDVVLDRTRILAEMAIKPEFLTEFNTPYLGHPEWVHTFVEILNDRSPEILPLYASMGILNKSLTRTFMPKPSYKFYMLGYNNQNIPSGTHHDVTFPKPHSVIDWYGQMIFMIWEVSLRYDVNRQATAKYAYDIYNKYLLGHSDMSHDELTAALKNIYATITSSRPLQLTKYTIDAKLVNSTHLMYRDGIWHTPTIEYGYPNFFNIQSPVGHTIGALYPLSWILSRFVRPGEPTDLAIVRHTWQIVAKTTRTKSYMTQEQATKLRENGTKMSLVDVYTYLNTGNYAPRYPVDNIATKLRGLYNRYHDAAIEFVAKYAYGEIHDRELNHIDSLVTSDPVYLPGSMFLLQILDMPDVVFNDIPMSKLTKDIMLSKDFETFLTKLFKR